MDDPIPARGQGRVVKTVINGSWHACGDVILAVHKTIAMFVTFGRMQLLQEREDCGYSLVRSIRLYADMIFLPVVSSVQSTDIGLFPVSPLTLPSLKSTAEFSPTVAAFSG